MNSKSESAHTPIVIPAEILELVTNHGQFDLPRSFEIDSHDSIVVVRLRAYWGRLAELASGRTTEADKWLVAYNWAIEQENRV